METSSLLFPGGKGPTGDTSSNYFVHGKGNSCRSSDQRAGGQGTELHSHASKDYKALSTRENQPPGKVIEITMQQAMSSFAAASRSANYDENTIKDKFLSKLERISNIVTSHKLILQKRCEAVLEELLKHCIQAKSFGNAVSSVSRVDPEHARLVVQGIVSTYQDVHQSIVNAKPLLQKAAREADEQLGSSLTSVLLTKFSSPPWNQESHDSWFIVILSDTFQVIRSIEALHLGTRADHESTVWIAPSSFERSTTKYWIADEKLHDVLLTSVQEVPLLVYAHKGLLTRSDNETTSTIQLTGQQDEANEDSLWGKFSVPITSVYFDSRDMSLYKDRIARREGAQLLRARWYGHQKPVGDQHIFLELKTHHEKWVNMKSVKERVTICEKDMKRFLSHDEGFSRELAETIVKTARSNQKDTKKEITEATELLLRMRKLVVQHKLRPCVRSAYLRAAFQSPDTNTLRLTVDCDVTLVEKKLRYDQGDRQMMYKSRKK